MKLKIQKRISAKILKCSPKKVKLDTASGEDIKEAITKKDLRILIKDKVIIKKRSAEVSRSRARKIQKQKSKGKRKGSGSKKGKINAKISKKSRWISRIRAQRKFLKELKDKGKITAGVYHNLYNKSKGGFFRSKRHITIYTEEHSLMKK